MPPPSAEPAHPRRTLARAVGRLLAPLCRAAGGTLGPWVIRRLADSHGSNARPLAPQEREHLAARFPAGLLDTVRVAHVQEIRTAPAWLERTCARLGLSLVASPVGIALGDLVVIAPTPRRLEVLEHEMVHVAQFRRLGLRGFCGEYAAGWASSGFSYRDIPLEAEAYARAGGAA